MLADFQGIGLYSHCSQSLPQRLEASKYSGLFTYFFNMYIYCERTSLYERVREVNIDHCILLKMVKIYIQVT